MDIKCPHCKDLVMDEVVGMWGWHKKRPNQYLLRLRCPECKATVTFSLPVVGDYNPNLVEDDG